MSNIKTEIEEVNRNYYASTYRYSSHLSAKLASLVSFDQQSKNRRNVHYARRALLLNKGKNLSVLDYGCGRGLFLHAFERYAGNLIGVDISPEAGAALTMRNWKSGTQFSFMLPPDFMDAQFSEMFDVICCSHVLEHVPDDETVIRLLSKSLKPDGVIVINLPVNEVYEDPNHCRKYSVESARSLLSLGGLEVLEQHLTDRWTAYLLSSEKLRHTSGAGRFIMRCLRGSLALLPLPLLEFSERLLPAGYEFQQQVLIGRKEVA